MSEDDKSVQKPAARENAQKTPPDKSKDGKLDIWRVEGINLQLFGFDPPKKTQEEK